MPMDLKNQQLKNNISVQPVSPIDLSIAKSRLSLVGLIFAVVAPPVGLVISAVALYKIKRDHLQGSRLAIFGIVWGSIFTLPLILLVLLLTSFGIFNGNGAKKAVQPFVSQIQKAGGKEICENGDNGHGIDNTQPWYEAYYELPDDSNLTSVIKTDAAQFGYPLETNTGLIDQLEGVPDKNGDISEPYGGATFNSKADYLVSEKNGYSLTITINRNTSVPLYCNENDYGKKQSTGNTNAILDVYFSLPDQNQ